jgi:hypothetical protein
VIAINFNLDVYNFEIDIESYQNPGMWPLVLNNTFIELCCLKGPAFFRIWIQKNSILPKKNLKIIIAH